MTSQYNGLQWREYAIRLYCFDRSPDGDRTDIHVSEPDLRHGFIAEHERDLAGVDPRDSRLSVGHGDWERPLWPGSELDPWCYPAAVA
jgi:hypothetical protein